MTGTYKVAEFKCRVSLQAIIEAMFLLLSLLSKQVYNLWGSSRSGLGSACDPENPGSIPRWCFSLLSKKHHSVCSSPASCNGHLALAREDT